jgi:hypothetical protein
VPEAGSRKQSQKPNDRTERGRREGERGEQKRMYYAKAIVSGASLYGSRLCPEDQAPTDSKSTGWVFGVHRGLV